MQSKMLTKEASILKKKFRGRNKKFTVSDWCRKKTCKGKLAFHCGDVIYYLKLEFKKKIVQEKISHSITSIALPSIFPWYGYLSTIANGAEE